MSRSNDLWFSFAGTRSDTMGVDLMALPNRKRPALKGEKTKVSGRNGTLWRSENAFDDITIQMSLRMSANADEFAVRSWLSGIGDLIICDAPDKKYRNARFVNEIEFKRFIPQNGAMLFDAKVECMPFLYMHPEAGDIEITQSPSSIPGAGTYRAAPKIKIEGNGDVVLLIGTQLLDIDGMSNGIIIDSELMECFNLEQSAFLNSKVSMDEFPALEPGSNIISWSGDGSISKITITPRWRYL